MKLFHTADWHLGKLVHGVYMTDDQRLVLQQFIQAIKDERPDAVIIAGDLYDRAVPPTEAVELLDEVLSEIVLNLKTPIIAIAGNHDSPGRLDFATKLMKANGLHLVGQLKSAFSPIVLHDEFGEVHFHRVPYAEPGIVRHFLQRDDLHNHHEAMEALIEGMKEQLDLNARHVFVGHAFVTPNGEALPNTSDSERPLSIGGAEHVSASLFAPFHYTALGHLHQAHHVGNPTIRYSGSPLKYSISEEVHKKGFLVVELGENGEVTVEKRLFTSRRDMRTVEGKMNELLKSPINDDYVFVRLLDETPVLSPMEKIRTIYPNAMHVERVISSHLEKKEEGPKNREKLSDQDLFKAFYKEVTGSEPSEDREALFLEVLEQVRTKGVEVL